MTMGLRSSGQLSPKCTGLRRGLGVVTTSATGSILGRTGLATPLSRSPVELVVVSGRTPTLDSPKHHARICSIGRGSDLVDTLLSLQASTAGWLLEGQGMAQFLQVFGNAQ